MSSLLSVGTLISLIACQLAAAASAHEPSQVVVSGEQFHTRQPNMTAAPSLRTFYLIGLAAANRGVWRGKMADSCQRHGSTCQAGTQAAFR
jgi:hypothetical protein